MRHFPSMRAGLAASAMAATGAVAQSVAPVMTDVAPLPAEERESSGAVVLGNSMVRAQREVFRASHFTRTRLVRADRDGTRATRAARTGEDLARQRDEDAMRLHEMGAGALTAP